MKNIKFRAYWGDVNKFKHFDSLRLTSDRLLRESCFGMFLPSTDGSVFLGKTEPEMFTGFKDSKGNDIYEGDIIGDWNEVDGKRVQSKLQVFWCEQTGAWMLDLSFSQNKEGGTLLSEELVLYDYEVIGNIHEHLKNKKKK